MLQTINCTNKTKKITSDSKYLSNKDTNFLPQTRRRLIFQTFNSVRLKSLRNSFKVTIRFQDTDLIKFEFVANI